MWEIELMYIKHLVQPPVQQYVFFSLKATGRLSLRPPGLALSLAAVMRTRRKNPRLRTRQDGFKSRLCLLLMDG